MVLVSELAYRVRALRDAHVAHLANERGGLVIEQCDVRVGCFAAVIEGEPSPNADSARRRLRLSQSPSGNVNDMNPVIAHLAVAGGPEPVPFVV